MQYTEYSEQVGMPLQCGEQHMNMNETWHTYERVVVHIHESRVTFERHGARMHESRLTHECVTTRI